MSDSKVLRRRAGEAVRDAPGRRREGEQRERESERRRGPTGQARSPRPSWIQGERAPPRSGRRSPVGESPARRERGLDRSGLRRGRFDVDDDVRADP